MAQMNPVEPFDLIIFGGTGDLALRKLIPALWHRHCDGQFPEGSRIIAIGRTALSLEDYVASFTMQDADTDERWSSFVERINYLHLEATDSGT